MVPSTDRSYCASLNRVQTGGGKSLQTVNTGLWSARRRTESSYWLRLRALYSLGRGWRSGSGGPRHGARCHKISSPHRFHLNLKETKRRHTHWPKVAWWLLLRNTSSYIIGGPVGSYHGQSHLPLFKHRALPDTVWASCGKFSYYCSGCVVMQIWIQQLKYATKKEKLMFLLKLNSCFWTCWRSSGCNAFHDPYNNHLHLITTIMP